MGVEEVISKLCKDAAIKAAFPLDGDFFREVVEEEGAVDECTMGMPLDNRALEAVKKKKSAVCIFCYGTFEVPTDHVMMMEDGCGNIVGHDVPSCLMCKYKDDPDIVWLCDDFAMYPHKACSQEMIMVMLPQKAKCVGKEEGVRDPVLLYPATSTDILLRKHFGIPIDDPKIASAIIAFDIDF